MAQHLIQTPHVQTRPAIAGDEVVRLAALADRPNHPPADDLFHGGVTPHKAKRPRLSPRALRCRLSGPETASRAPTTDSPTRAPRLGHIMGFRLKQYPFATGFDQVGVLAPGSITASID